MPSPSSLIHSSLELQLRFWEQAAAINRPVKHGIRGAGKQRQSIRPSFGTRSKIAEHWIAAVAKIWSALWATVWFQFAGIAAVFSWNITDSCISVFISYKLTAPTYKRFSEAPDSFSLSACWTQYYLHSSRKKSQWQDFCHVPRPEKVLLRVEGGKVKQVGWLSAQQMFVAKGSHSEHGALTWTWKLTFTCTQYTHALRWLKPCQSVSTSQRWRVSTLK